jgi:hypothetical protein
MSINTIPTRAACLLLAALFALGAPAIGEAQTGYWQYVKTDSYIDLYANMGGKALSPTLSGRASKRSGLEAPSPGAALLQF